jgi:hypothetical protein
MEFAGQVWFDFADDAVWRFYRFVRALAGSGNTVTLEWRALPGRGHDQAAAIFEALDTPDARGRFLHAMLGLVHIEGADPSDETVVRRACAEAGVAEPTGARSLEGVEALARDLGVVGVPSLYRHGPVMEIELTEAALSGDVAGRATRILAVADDDGIWQLDKPSGE